MISNSFHSDNHSRTSQSGIGIRLVLVLACGIPLLLTFLVPLNRLVLFDCPFLNVTGIPCPFCGFTRSIWAISAGDWVYATVNSPIALMMYAALVIVLSWNITCLLTGMKMKMRYMATLTPNRANRAAGIIIALIFFNWIYRLSLGLT